MQSYASKQQKAPIPTRNGSRCEVEISGNDIGKLDRNRNGGGVAIFIQENIPYIFRQDLVTGALELLCIEVTNCNLQ